MANYNIQYRMEFDDMQLAVCRIDILKKDGDILVEPIMLTGGAVPLRLDKQNRDESAFSPIIKTVATITYVYRGGTDPMPAIFANIQADDYLVEVYLNKSIKWKGFLSTDFNTYPFLPPPFPISLKATDFTFMDGRVINLDSASLFLYDYITIGDFFNRSLFYATGYDNPVLKILYNKKPASIGSGKITSDLYIHTDAFYDFVKGAKFVTDCLEQLLESIGARLFYDNGAYWLQYIEDIDDLPRNILTITPVDTAGVISNDPDIGVVLANEATAELRFTDRTADVLINKPLKQQTFNYDLKAINQVANFDWRTDAQSPFDNWEGDITGFFTRVGSGGVADPFRLHIEHYSGPGQRSIWSRIPVLPTKLVEIEMKVKGFITLPAPSAITYRLYLKAIVVLVEVGSIVPLKYMDSGGQWIDASGGGVGNNQYYHVDVEANAGSFGTLNIRSKPIPLIETSPDLEILFQILTVECEPSPPPGTTYYVELYPVFARIYTSPYVRIDEKVTNNNNYSFIDEDKPLFFNDTQDTGYSNTIFYDDAGEKKALPPGDWEGKTIDETAVKLRADQQSRQGYSILGTFRSNNTSFANLVYIADLSYKHALIIRDSYDVKRCTHNMMITEIMPEGSANITYNKLPLTEEQTK